MRRCRGQRGRRFLRFEALQAEVNINSADDDDGVSQGDSQLPPQVVLLLSTLGRLWLSVICRDVDHPPSTTTSCQSRVACSRTGSTMTTPAGGGDGDSPATGMLSTRGSGLPARQLPIACVLGIFSGRRNKVISGTVSEFCCCCCFCFFVQSCDASGHTVLLWLTRRLTDRR